MKKNSSEWRNRMLWAMSLVALISSGCATVVQQSTPQKAMVLPNKFKELDLARGLVSAYDLNGKKLWDFATDGLSEETVLGPENSVLVRATHYKVVHGDDWGGISYAQSKLYALDCRR